MEQSLETPLLLFCDSSSCDDLHELDRLFEVFRKEKLTFDQKYDYTNDFTHGLVELIDSGSSSDIFRVTNSTESYVLKATQDLSMYKRELAALQRLSHPYLITLKAVTIINRHYCLCLEDLINHVSLWEYVRCSQHQLPETELLGLFTQMVSAVAHMHERRISHHDLNSRNIMVDTESKKVKIIDFGLSVFVPLGGLVDHAFGTPLYLPLEVLEGKTHDPLAVDVWSLGVILVEMLLRYHPWKSSKSLSDLAINIIQMNNVPQNPYYSSQPSHHPQQQQSNVVSSFTSNVIHRMLSIDPSSRATIQQVDLLFNRNLVSLVG